MKNQIRIAIVGIAVLSSSAALLAQADVYKTKCAMCHAADGKAETPAGKAMKVPSFIGLKSTEAEMIAITKNGKGKMPAYAGKLTDAQIKGTVDYIRTLK
ncbi:MAG TPA: cytochrome c [Acidobacteriaceae bacterium]